MKIRKSLQRYHDAPIKRIQNVWYSERTRLEELWGRPWGQLLQDSEEGQFCHQVRTSSPSYATTFWHIIPHINYGIIVPALWQESTFPIYFFFTISKELPNPSSLLSKVYSLNIYNKVVVNFHKGLLVVDCFVVLIGLLSNPFDLMSCHYVIVCILI